MFSSAAERERDKWGTQLDALPSTSDAASPANATGRKRKANFSNDETEALVWNVVRHFSALYGSESFRAHPVRRKQLWTQIQSRVNFLGYTERSIDDLKHKWRDLRLDVKKKITAKKPPPAHRQEHPHKPRLTPLEKMVASTFLQPTHDSEPEIVLDPEIFFPGASRHSFLPMQPGASHPGIYIDTNGQPSSLPTSEGPTIPRLSVQSPDLALMCDYSQGEGHSSSESGPERRTPEMPAVSPPPLRNESLVSYASMSEEEERDVPEGEGGSGHRSGLGSLLSAEEDGTVSGQRAMLIRSCSSQGSTTSLPEDPLNSMDTHSDWGPEGMPGVPALGRVLGPPRPEQEETASPSADTGSFPHVLMGPRWGRQEDERQSGSPTHAGALTEESLPSSESLLADPVPAPHPRPRRTGRSRLREGRREAWRTNIHCLMDLEDQWDRLYHQELAMWQEERAQQREERARDRELQVQLLGILTDIRDELRYLRQERTTARQERASQTVARIPAPAPTASSAQRAAAEASVRGCRGLSVRLQRPQRAAAEASARGCRGLSVRLQRPLSFPLKGEGSLSGPPPVGAGRGEAAMLTRSPRGTPRRGRGRPRGSISRHRRLFTTNS